MNKSASEVSAATSKSPASPQSGTQIKKNGSPPFPRGSKPEAPLFFKLAYWSFLGLVLLLLAILLFKPFFSPAAYLLPYVQHMAMAVIAVCVALWLGDIVNFLKIPVDVRKAIFSAFIIVVLTAAGAHVATAWSHSSRLSMRVTVFDEALVEKGSTGKYLPAALELRTNHNYVVPEDQSLRLFVGAVVGDFRLNAAGHNDLELIVLFYGAADTPIGDISTIEQTNPDDWKTLPFSKQLGEKVVAEKLRLSPGETVFLMHLRIEPSAVSKIPSRRGTVRIIARDNATGASATWTLPITIASVSTAPR